MNPNRILAGMVCIALAFIVVVALAMGGFDPPGAGAARTPRELIGAYLPFLGGSFVLFVIGLWLIRRPRG